MHEPPEQADNGSMRSALVVVDVQRDFCPGRDVRAPGGLKAAGGGWPPHCVQNSPGAAFHPDLKLPPDAIVINKGDDDDQPGYSAFDGHTVEGQALIEIG